MSVVNETNSVLSKMLGHTEPAKKEEDYQSRFLTLLTTQLRNQDPLNPMENAEMTSQLAQMSTVDGIERLNDMVKELLEGRGENQAMQAAALVGHGVLVEGDGMILTEAGAIGGFEVPQGAASVKLTITDSSGLEVAVVEFENVEAGSHNYIWDGTTNDGSVAAEGLYRVSLTAGSNGESVPATTLEYGQVSGVIRGKNGADLQVGSLGVFRFEDIKQII